VTKEGLLSLYETMLLIRRTELQLSRLFADGEVPGFIHLSIGQEAVAAGVMSALGRADTISTNHRGHGHVLAKGIDLERFFMEVMGRAGGICAGRGGSMHVADASVGVLGANGIVAGGLSIAAGSALAHKVRRTGRIAAVFFGDGALAEGVFHESMNMAALWGLPLLFVCENNGWSEFSPSSRQFAANLERLSGAFGIPYHRSDGNDVEDVAKMAKQAVEGVRSGGKPAVLECITLRVRGHYEGDAQKYRDAAELVLAERKDPLAKTAAALRERFDADPDLARVDARVTARIAEAVGKARAGELPDFLHGLADVYTRGGER